MPGALLSEKPMKKSVKIVIGAVFAIIVIAVIWYVSAKFQQKSESVVKIGIMTMTTGDLAFLGDNIVKSAELAAKEMGYDKKIQFIIEDVGQLGGGSNTLTGYRKLVDSDKVQVIIDGMTSDGTMAVAPQLEKDKVVMITPLTGGENVDNASEYLFRNGPSDVAAGTKPAGDLIGKFNYQKIVLFTDNAEYTLDISKHFRNAYRGMIVSDQVITPTKTDYKTEISKIQNQDFDAIVINTADGVSSSYLIKQLYELGIRKSIFANFIAFSDNALTTASRQAFEGVYIYDPEFDENLTATKNFFSEYNKTYGKNPAIPFHSAGTYDAVKMVMQAVNNVGYDGKAIHDYLLKNIKNWQGLNGVVSFDAKGNTQTGFVLKQVQNGKLLLVK